MEYLDKALKLVERNTEEKTGAKSYFSLREYQKKMAKVGHSSGNQIYDCYGAAVEKNLFPFSTIDVPTLFHWAIDLWTTGP